MSPQVVRDYMKYMKKGIHNYDAGDNVLAP